MVEQLSETHRIGIGVHGRRSGAAAGSIGTRLRQTAANTCICGRECDTSAKAESIQPRDSSKITH
jgi:hypothetical protein